MTNVTAAITAGDFDADLDLIAAAIRRRKAARRALVLPRARIRPDAGIRPLYLNGAHGYFDAEEELFYCADDLERGWRMGRDLSLVEVL